MERLKWIRRAAVWCMILAASAMIVSGAPVAPPDDRDPVPERNGHAPGGVETVGEAGERFNLGITADPGSTAGATAEPALNGVDPLAIGNMLAEGAQSISGLAAWADGAIGGLAGDMGSELLALGGVDKVLFDELRTGYVQFVAAYGNSDRVRMLVDSHEAAAAYALQAGTGHAAEPETAVAGKEPVPETVDYEPLDIGQGVTNRDPPEVPVGTIVTVILVGVVLGVGLFCHAR